MALADQYSALMRYRDEGLKKYGTSTATVTKGPPAKITLPGVSGRDEFLYHKRVGPFYVGLKSAITPYVTTELETRAKAAQILEIGPGAGELADYLQRTSSDKIARYFGLDRDLNVTGRFELLPSVAAVPGDIDIVIASEVIEHMHADDFHDNLLQPLRSKLSRSAVAIFTTPNPLSPGGIARDFTHVQNYPWYDLYALLRLTFSHVDVYRNFAVGSPSKLLSLLPRIACCAVMDLDWCDRLICVARTPVD